MTPLGPPKLAPKGTPASVALYLDNAAEYLRPIAQDAALDLKPYDVLQPERGTWAHHLYGTAWKREFAIQVAANDRDAHDFKATVTGFVKRVGKKGDRWISVEAHQVLGMAGLMTCVEDLIHDLRTAYTARMLHPKSPDPKA